MSQDTAIQFCDSSINLSQGCTGCELWNKTKRVCYAGVMTEKWGGRKGWPKSFAEPEIFPDRIKNAETWKDLSGIRRRDKPWLDGMPRVIFLNDMGETFDAKLPLDWLSAFLPALERSPHIYLILTKRPSRFAEFSRQFSLPLNVWPGTTITSEKFMDLRLRELLKVEGGGPKWLSVEPMWSEIVFDDRLSQIQWATFGGESKQFEGHKPTPLNLGWILRGIEQCRAHGTAPFVKQVGSAAYFMRDGNRIPFPTRDGHGGSMAEWPEALRVREMPAFKSHVLL